MTLVKNASYNKVNCMHTLSSYLIQNTVERPLSGNLSIGLPISTVIKALMRVHLLYFISTKWSAPNKWPLSISLEGGCLIRAELYFVQLLTTIQLVDPCVLLRVCRCWNERLDIYHYWYHTHRVCAMLFRNILRLSVEFGSREV